LEDHSEIERAHGRNLPLITVDTVGFGPGVDPSRETGK
jgi:hypothetical protein